VKLNSLTRSIITFILIVAVVLIVATFLSNTKKPEDISYDELLSKIEAGEVHAIDVSGYFQVRVLYTNSPNQYTLEDFPKQADAKTIVLSRDGLEERIAEMAARQAADPAALPDFKMPTITADDPTEGNIWSTIIPILGILALGALLFFMYRQSQSSNNKAMSFGKTRARQNINVKVRFADVAGAVEEKEELREIVDFLKNPKKFLDVGARIPRGVLLVGPPGTGKTLFAKAVAGEASVPFFSISGSDFVEMFVGVGASRVRDLFEQAKRNMPCIIFIDEIDAVGRQRGAGLGGGHDEREQTLNQLLVQMDGFETNEGIIIMAATNRVDILDPALLRPGRFDRQIYVHIPDVKGREAIFKVHARNKPIASDIDFKVLSRMTSGFTGADIENLLNESAILAARANRKIIIMSDILEGINKVIVGPQKKSRVVTESDKRITAYHEVGHAVVAKILPGCEEVQEVSIIPRGQAAGYTLTRPDRDDQHITQTKLTDMITMLLGGRAAEELVIHDITTGASSDIHRANDIARTMVTEWGMSPLGNIYLGGSTEVFLGRDYTKQHNYSEQIAGKIDEEVKKLIDDSYNKAKDILSKNRVIMDNMVKLLFDKETIYAEEVDMLFKGVPYEEIVALIDKRAKEREEMAEKASDLFIKESEVNKDTKKEDNTDSSATDNKEKDHNIKEKKDDKNLPH
jgi:cell division protease FtsH